MVEHAIKNNYSSIRMYSMYFPLYQEQKRIPKSLRSHSVFSVFFFKMFNMRTWASRNEMLKSNVLTLDWDWSYFDPENISNSKLLSTNGT